MGETATWVTEPPIVIYTNADWVTCRRLARQLRADITDWSEGGVPNVGRNAINMCNTIHDAVHMDQFGASCVFFAYMYSGRPLALMLLNPTMGQPYVNDLVAHPGAEGGGAIMCEFALNYLRARQRPELLKLWALNAAAVGPYLGMGYQSSATEAQDMLLNPRLQIVRDKWQDMNGKWRYISTRNPGPKYASKP
jgi:hypothetical protein